MNDQLFMTLNQWVDKHYRDRLAQRRFGRSAFTHGKPYGT